ncbi:MAG TPA: SRPBCC domain-containing protein, partial [Candidatus Kapabacteria bacterium]|nr:SRPBCC domain-containing protein [Candidatus Kapabacteria bacterium]
GMGGEFLEVNAPKRYAATEKFDEAWYDGAATSSVDFTEINGTTTVTMTVRYDSKEIRDKVLESPMETGVSAGYDLLEQLLANINATA